MLSVPEEVIELFKTDSTFKNFRVEFVNGEYPDITNENIVSESVQFTESVCSSEFKLGLCESPVLQFETVDIPNIKNKIIRCYIEIECSSTVEGSVYRSDINKRVYPVPYGVFKVDSCKRQAQLNHRKIEAYGLNLMSELTNLIDELRYQFGRKASTSSTTSAVKRALTYIKEPNIDNLDLSIDSIVSATDSTTFIRPEWRGNYMFRIRTHYLSFTLDTTSDVLYILKKAVYDKSRLEYIKNEIYDILDGYRDYMDNTSRYGQVYNRKFFANFENSFVYDISPKIYNAFFKETKSQQDYFTGFYTILEDENTFLYEKYTSKDTCKVRVPYKVDWYDVRNNVVEYEFDIMNTSDIELSTIVNETLLTSIQLTETTSKDNGYYYIQRSEDFNQEAIFNILNAYAELKCKLYRTDRNGQLKFFFPNGDYPVFPANDLFPSDRIHPSDSSAGYITKTEEKQAWYDEFVNKYIQVSVTYKNSSNEDEVYIKDIIENMDIAQQPDPFYSNTPETTDIEQYNYGIDLSEIENVEYTVINTGEPYTSIGFVHNDQQLTTDWFTASDYDLSAFPSDLNIKYFKELPLSTLWEVQDIIGMIIYYTSTENVKFLNLYECNLYIPENSLTYDFSDNYIIEKGNLSSTTICACADNIANHLEGLDYMSCSVDMRGLPFLEAGDCVVVETQDGEFNTIILEQNISGIQSLMTKIDAEGD